ncbi:MAG: TetR/AcrR family transcriptional regulator, partial [Anaerolineales bacterium]
MSTLGKKMKAPEPTTQTRPRLNRQLVLRTVLEIIDREGLEALNMRRLGAELSADPMTIYHHAGKK